MLGMCVNVIIIIARFKNNIAKDPGRYNKMISPITPCPWILDDTIWTVNFRTTSQSIAFPSPIIIFISNYITSGSIKCKIKLNIFLFHIPKKKQQFHTLIIPSFFHIMFLFQ